jgi:peptidoglycan/xylan/chitin deacetylase (PgdA/CDA1 family)
MRSLLTWDMVGELSALGVEFAAHSLTHPDLTSLPPQDARAEIKASGRILADRIGRKVEGFAAPYGRITPALLGEVRRSYSWAVGTRMARARETSDLFDLPRIEMWYFQDTARWRRYVERGWTPYFELRRLLRRVKHGG